MSVIVFRLTSKKLGIKPGKQARLVHAPSSFVKEMGRHGVKLKSRLAGMFDYLHLFVVSQKEFHKKFKSLKSHLKKGGMLWVSWPKSGQKETDLTLTKVIKLGYDYGLVESKTISLDSVWSAIKFTHPKEGKVYKNSYGKLKN